MKQKRNPLAICYSALIFGSIFLPIYYYAVMGVLESSTTILVLFYVLTWIFCLGTLLSILIKKSCLEECLQRKYIFFFKHVFRIILFLLFFIIYYLILSIHYFIGIFSVESLFILISCFLISSLIVFLFLIFFPPTRLELFLMRLFIRSNANSYLYSIIGYCLLIGITMFSIYIFYIYAFELYDKRWI